MATVGKVFKSMRQYNRYVLFAVLLLLAGDAVSLFVSEQIKHLLIFFICCFVIINSKVFNGRISNSEFKWVVIPAICILIPQLLYIDLAFSYEYKIAQLLVGFIIASQIPFEDFSDKYIRVLYVICVVSIIVWITDVLHFNWTWLPISDNDGAGSYYHSMVITTIPGGRLEHGRNNGPFEEPGVLQVYINIAIMFMLFLKRVNKKVLAILVMGLLSTVSTTGFICFFIILLAYFYENGRHINFIHILFAMLFLVLGVYYILSTPELYTRLFGKFEEGSESYGSFVIRMNDILFYYEYWTQNFSHFIFGGGSTLASDFANYNHSIADYKFTGGTSTTIRELASYGLLFQVIKLTIMYKFTTLFGRKFLTRLLLCLCFLVFINTENFLYAIMFNALFYFGTTKLNRTTSQIKV